MKRIKIRELTVNFIEAIGKEWMLITAGTEKSFNTMTASWGGIGFMWGAPIVFVFVRPERYTHQFIEQGDYFTLSFLGEENKAIHNVCGSKSGRDVDKVKETGLKPIVSARGNILFEQAYLSMECRKLYATKVKKEDFLDKSYLKRWYEAERGGYHTAYFAEITDIWGK